MRRCAAVRPGGAACSRLAVYAALVDGEPPVRFFCALHALGTEIDAFLYPIDYLERVSDALYASALGSH